jgi:hypothetical protein
VAAAGSSHRWRMVVMVRERAFGGIGFFNKEDSTRKGGTVQVRTSERIIRAE